MDATPAAAHDRSILARIAAADARIDARNVLEFA
jgi:hypothetical protein